MTRISLLHESSGAPSMEYRAVSAGIQAMGRTAGEALDALASQLPQEDGQTLVIVRGMLPDRYFTAEQRDRLRELMDRKKGQAAIAGSTLTDQEEAELARLIDAEVHAATERSDALLRELSS